MMKNKFITVLLGCILVCSIALNIILLWTISETKGQVAVFSDKVLETDSQLDDLYQQISNFNDLKDQVEILRGQLDDSEKQAATLQASLSENEILIKSLEDALEESNATIEELERQQKEIVEKPANTPAPQQQIQQPGEFPAGLGGFTIGDIPMGTNPDPAPGTLGVGHFE